MKRLFIGSTAAACLLIAFSALSGAQTSAPSLGDYARSVKQNKPQATKAPAKVYDNDTIASSTAISVVGSAPQTVADNKDASSADAKTADAKTSDQSDVKTADTKSSDKTPAADSKAGDKKAPEIKPGQSLEDRQKAFEVWEKKIAEQKKKVDQLARELNDYQHNSTLAQVSVWPENQKYGQGLAEKQKALDQAKAELSDLQERARKAGAPASIAE